MFIKDLYINPDNVCTVVPFSEEGYYGLQINGTKFNIGEYDEWNCANVDWDLITRELKNYQEQIVNEIEYGHTEIAIKEDKDDWEDAMRISPDDYDMYL